jgi:subtilisin-like proprotein convertase family protein
MKRLLGLLAGFLAISSALAQLTTQTGFTAQQLGNILAGSNIQVNNATVNGAAASFGKFQFAGSGFPMSSGVILSTGLISDAAGPNNSSSTTSVMGTPGNTLLTQVAGVQTYDAVEFQFDFEVQSDKIEFKYIFASEEYNEFVGSAFNDVFAFYISGPGITGWKNIALIPNTSTPVAINNVNNGSYWQYFKDNTNNAYNIEYDGFTAVLTAKEDSLLPCNIYTLKLVIADAGDGAFDAAVFLQENSLVQNTVDVSTSTFSGNDTALEGCIDASFTFNLDSIASVPVVIPYVIAGTALNGVDYVHIDTAVTIQPGQTSATIIIDAIADGLPEGLESIMLIYSPGPCTTKDTVVMYINDYQQLNYQTTPTNLTCNNNNSGQVNVNITGGTAPYTVILTDTLTNISNSYTSLPITGLAAGTYSVQVLDAYGCKAEDVVVAAGYNGGPIFIPDGNQGQSYVNTLNIAGFQPGQTLQNISQLQSVCMNMEHSFIGSVDIFLTAPNGTQITLKPQPGGAQCDFGEPVATGPNDVNGSTNLTAGTGYTYCFTPTPSYGTMVVESNNYTHTYVSTQNVTLTDKYLPAGAYTSHDPLSNLIGTPLNGNWTLTITDHIPNNNGYVFSWNISLNADLPDSIVTLTQPSLPTFTYTTTQPTCGASNGAIDISVSGTGSPFTYTWSTGASTQDITNVAAGNYSVNIGTSTACTYAFNTSLSNNGSLALSAAITPQACPSTSTGSINLTPTGGTSPLTYSWSTGAATQDISNLAPGTYSVVVTDANACVGAAVYTVSAATPMAVTAAVADENCGDMEGTIDITPQGGTGPYTFSWSNGATTEDVQNLAQGSYTVTVTDAKGCTKTASYSVINLVGNCIPSCDLALQNSSVSNELCGNNNGGVSLQVYTTHYPLSASWSNGSNSLNLSGVAAGIYSVTLSDAEGCQVVQTYTLVNQTTGLAITGLSSSNETCGNNNGSINITVSGGSQPYVYGWSNGAGTEDIVNLSAGTYSVSITDASGCSTAQSYTIQNNAGTLAQTYGNAMDESCGNAQGSIDITITGGNTPYTYSWSNGGNTQDLVNLSAGTYSCVITDQSGCMISTPTYTVNNQSGGFSIFNTDADDEVCSNGAGSITLFLSGGSAPYTYTWSTGANTSSLSNLSAGTYSCTVADASGCSVNTGNITIVNDPGTLALTNVASMPETCGNGAGSLSVSFTGGTSPYSIQWSTGATTSTIVNLSAGSYTCQVTDAQGCVTGTSASVSNNAGTLVINNMIASNETCGDQTGAVSLLTGGGTAPLSYSWSNGATSQNISNLHAGTFSVTVTDANGCTANNSVVVGNNAGTLAAGITSQSSPLCGNSNGAINITVSGGTLPYTYAWSNGAGSEDISGLAPGSYSCTITDGAGCKVIIGPVTLTNSSGSLAIATNTVTNEVCNNNQGAVSLAVSGGTTPYVYAWSNGGNTPAISNLNSGVYTVSVTDGSGCSTTGSYTVGNSAGTLAITNASVSDEICNNNAGAINITVSGATAPYTYTWSNGATTQNLSGLSNGSYSVIVSSSNGCSLTGGPYTVNNNPGSFTLSSVLTSSATCNNSSGAVNVTFSGGAAPITYTWSNGANTEDISGVSAGVYTLTAVDNNGCTQVVNATVGNNAGTLAVSTSSISASTCGNANGAIDISVSGGANPYTFAWSNGAVTEDISGVGAGTYTVFVTDASGCSSSYAASVGTNGGNPVVSSMTVTNEVCNNGQGCIGVNASGGTAPYTYSWSSPPCCTYSLTMDGSGGAWFTAKVKVDINGVQYGLFNHTGGPSTTVQIPVCAGDLVQLTWQPGGSTSKWFYLYDGSGAQLYYSGVNPPAGLAYTGTAGCSAGGNGATLCNLSAGVYSVTVTDANGCSTVASATVNNSSGTTSIASSSVTDEVCGNGQGSVSVVVSGGTVSSYSWSNGGSTATISNLGGGVYTVTVTPTSGCVIVQSFTVNNTTSNLAFTSSGSAADCGGSNGSASVSATGSNAPFAYAWSSGGTSATETNLAAGIYTVTVTDALGCSVTNTVQVNANPNTLAAIAQNVVNDSCGAGSGSITVAVSGGNGGNTFAWSNGASTQNISGIGGGVYTFTVTDQLGCTASSSFTVANAAPFSLSMSATGATCLSATGTASVSVSGPGSFTYLWNNASAGASLSGLTPGWYSVVVTDTSGCKQKDSVQVASNPGALAIGSSQVIDENCGDALGQITLSPSGNSGPVTYSWSNGETSAAIDSLAAGTYTVTLTDSIGCSVTASYTVNNDPPVFSVQSFTVTNATCLTCADGAVNITVNWGGPIPPGATFSWSNGAGTEDISGVLPGVYTVTLSDGTGCSVTQTYTVSAPTGVAAYTAPQLDAYPNPSKGAFTIAYVTGVVSLAEFKVYNAIGEVVFSRTIENSSAGEFLLDLSPLGNGVYYLEFTSGAERRVLKLMKTF